MDNAKWIVEIRVEGLSKKHAERLFDAMLALCDIYPKSIPSGSVRRAVDWPTERAAILEAVDAVDDDACPCLAGRVKEAPDEP